MKAIILAAGEGTRLRPFTVSRPKGMIPVGNKPILQHIVESLVQNDLKEIVMVVGYKKDRILSYFEDGRKFGARISYVMQDKQLGTAHALLMAGREIQEDNFLVLPGDNFIDAQTVSDLTQQGKPPSVLVTESEIPSKYGVLQLEGDRVNSIVEKPQWRAGNIISTGMYSFTPEIFRMIESQALGADVGISHVLQSLLPKLDLRAVHTTGKWIDAVYPWDLTSVNAVALEIHGQRVNDTVEPGVTLKGPVSIGVGTRIRSGCYIEGPVSIGEGCDIGPNVTILASTSIGNGVQVEPFSFISNCLIMSNVLIGSHSHLSHSVVDDGVKAKAGLFASSGVAFARVDKELFRINEVGALIGQDCTIGSRVVISSGSIVGAGCRIDDGVRVSCNLENKSVVV